MANSSGSNSSLAPRLGNRTDQQTSEAELALHHDSDPVCRTLPLDHWHFVSDGLNCMNVTQGCYLCRRNEMYIRVDVAVQITLLLVSVIGNCIVLASMSRQLRRKTIGRSELFITNVCIADLLVTFGGILTSVIEKLTQFFYGPFWLCKLVRYLQLVSFVASTFSIVAMAIDRYIAIVHPMTMYSASSGIVYSLIVVPWIAALLFSMPQLFFFDLDYIPECNVRGCYDIYHLFPNWMMKTYITMFFVIVYLVPAVILLFTYCVLSLTIWRTVQLREKGLINISRRTSSKDDRDHCVHPVPAPAWTAQAFAISNATNNRVEQDRMSLERLRTESLVSRERSNTSGTKVTVRSHAHSRMRFRAVAMTATIVVVFMLSWAPFTITQLWLLYDITTAPTDQLVFIIGTTLAYFSSCFNPWIFLAFNARRVCYAISRRATWRATTGSLFN